MQEKKKNNIAIRTILEYKPVLVLVLYYIGIGISIAISIDNSIDISTLVLLT